MAKPAKSTQRRCLVTRESRDPGRLVRFVVDPEGIVRPDIEQRLPGRGMWLSAERDVVDRAVAKNLFAKAARAQVRARPDLAAEVERLLARRALDTLGLARRAGQLTAGFERVRVWLQTEAAAILVAASDAAADGRAKLRRLAPDLPVVTAFSSSELGAALGREMLVHAAVAPGGLARRLLCDVERLAGFRPDVIEWPARSAESLESSAIPATTGSR